VRLNTMLLSAALILSACGRAKADTAYKEWTERLHADDIVAGRPLEKLKSRHQWVWQNDVNGFDIAVRKSAIPILAPQCRMDYLILTMGVPYSESAPKQAAVIARQAVYDALLKLLARGEVPDCIRTSATGKLSIAARHLKMSDRACCPQKSNQALAGARTYS
jgi:hypothetical protein